MRISDWSSDVCSSDLENVLFFPDGAAARAAGYRACLRCKPDEVARDRVAVDRALALMEGAEHMPKLEDLAAHVGYAPHHFHRLFKRTTGVPPAAYERKLRSDRRSEERAVGKEWGGTW